jgi:toxin ParE1/3/4
MTLRIEVSEAAEMDLAAAASWYEERGAGLGADLVSRTRETMQRIAQNPLIYPILHGSLRRAGVKRFPYGVFFRVFDEHIEIAAIFHDRRDPMLWQQR